MSHVAPKQVNKMSIFFRLTRAQFLPLIFLPALVGAALSFQLTGRLNPGYLGITLLGVILLHLGANAIDDCYDYENGVDNVANEMFPPDFGGWKPLPRQLITLRNAKLVSFALFVGSLIIGLYFTIVVGTWAIIFGASGVLLAIFYTAPPLKLDYHGYGLGEIAILLAFGPIPLLGSYYVQTGGLSLTALLLSIPIGIITVTVLIDHDLIFYEVYMKSKKFSLATILGRRNALRASLGLTSLSYAIVVILVAMRAIPVQSIAAPVVSGLLLLPKARTFSHPNEAPPYYLPFALNGMMSDWIFSLVLSIALFL